MFPLIIDSLAKRYVCLYVFCLFVSNNIQNIFNGFQLNFMEASEIVHGKNN